MFPVEITYLNIYDPAAQFQNDRAGVEIYSWHGGGLPWPAGLNMVHAVKGPATLLPPRAIYQQEDIEFVHPGDFDADFDIDLADFQWFQFCADPTFFFLPSFCRVFDFNGDEVVDGDDYRSLWGLSGGAGEKAESRARSVSTLCGICAPMSVVVGLLTQTTGNTSCSSWNGTFVLV